MSFISYSEKYYDHEYEYRVVSLAHKVEDVDKILSQEEAYNLGIRQSPGWEHVLTWNDNLSLLFKRKLTGG